MITEKQITDLIEELQQIQKNNLEPNSGEMERAKAQLLEVVIEKLIKLLPKN